MVQLSHLCMTTGKTIVLTIWTFVGKVMSLLFNTLSRFIIAFLPRGKHLLILWLQSLSPVIFEAQENKTGHCFHFSLIDLPWSGGTRWLEVFSLQATCSRPDAMRHNPWPTSFYWDPPHVFPAPLIKHEVAVIGTQNRSVAAQWWWMEVTRYKREEGNFQVDHENDLLIKEKTAPGSWETVWRETKDILGRLFQHRLQFCCLEKQGHLLRLQHMAQISFLCSLEHQWGAGNTRLYGRLKILSAEP